MLTLRVTMSFETLMKLVHLKHNQLDIQIYQSETKQCEVFESSVESRSLHNSSSKYENVQVLLTPHQF